MRRVTILIAGALVLAGMVAYNLYRGTPETARMALHESSSRGGAYVQFSRTRHIHISLKAQGAPGGYLDAFDAVASTQRSDAVATCLHDTPPWAVNARCVKPGWMSALVSRVLRARMVTAVFPDGSARTYAFDGDADRYVPVPGSAHDRFENGIPENIAMASNGGGLDTYLFQGAGSNQDRAQFVRQLLRLGIGGNYTDGENHRLITCVARRDATVCLHTL